MKRQEKQHVKEEREIVFKNVALVLLTLLDQLQNYLTKLLRICSSLSCSFEGRLGTQD